MNLSEILGILFYACIVEQIAPSPSRSWAMSVTDGDHMDGYCLIYSLKQKFHINSATYQNYEQLIDYCLRPAHRKMTITNIEDHYETWTSQLNFHDLRAKNISSDQLLSWSAPVDLAEDYQIFLIKPTNVSSKKVFYNCTSSWFGPLCQFSFRHSTTESFYAMVRLRFAAKLPPWQSLSPTCYEHHPCRTTSSICLDWRQICDNRKDCLDGSDESLCFSIETSKPPPGLKDPGLVWWLRVQNFKGGLLLRGVFYFVFEVKNPEKASLLLLIFFNYLFRRKKK